MNQLQKIGTGIRTAAKNFLNVGTTYKEKSPKNINSYLSKTQMFRERIDLQGFKEALNEAERQILPYRVKLNKVYNQCILNDHVSSCIKRRTSLTTLKNFQIVDQSGKENEVVTKMFTNKGWFKDFMRYALEAQYHGYSLIQLGDIEKGELKDTTIVRRRNVSPDRTMFSNIEYMPGGFNFIEDEEFAKWSVYIKTPSDIGESICGYGLLLKVALLEIFLRNNLTFNANYVELFSQPIRWAKTDKLEGAEYDSLEASMRDMGNSAYIITSMMEEIELLNNNGGGAGFKAYESFQSRLEGGITKYILGHSSALDAVAGKLGSSDDILKALDDCEKEDAQFMAMIVNDILFDKLRGLGYNIPLGLTFQFKNDKEVLQARKAENDINLVEASVYKTILEAGGTPDWEMFTERTGVKMATAGEDLIDNGVPVKQDIEAEARASLRGSVGGVTGILSLQASVSQGITSFEAAVSLLEIVYGYDTESAKMILGQPKPAPALPTGQPAKIKEALNKLYI